MSKLCRLRTNEGELSRTSIHTHALSHSVTHSLTHSLTQKHIFVIRYSSYPVSFESYSTAFLDVLLSVVHSSYSTIGNNYVNLIEIYTALYVQMHMMYKNNSLKFDPHQRREWCHLQFRPSNHDVQCLPYCLY